jgi:hypothetical protein
MLPWVLIFNYYDCSVTDYNIIVLNMQTFKLQVREISLTATPSVLKYKMF